MSKEKYNREKVYEYAKKWAYSRNPQYYNYDAIGGDYINGNNKSPSWTGVEFLYDFLVYNKGAGPFGKETTINNLDIGDVIQLSFDGVKFSHTMIVIQSSKSILDTLVAAHTFDTFGKKVSDYDFYKYRYKYSTSSSK